MKDQILNSAGPGVEFASSEDFARQLDADDPLREFRAQFHIPRREDGRPVAYFCGNSLGLQPLAADELVQREMEQWRRHAVDAHFLGSTPWYSYHEVFRERGARLVGALPGEVVMMNSLTTNLHLMMVSFYRPAGRRHKILIEYPAFPSDLYAVKSQLRCHGHDLEEALITVRPAEGENTLNTEDFESVLQEQGEDIALVLLAGVNFFSGQVLDMARITAAAKACGCVVGFDLAHAAGNVPLALHDWGVDFAVWCSYKYLNAGPGAVAGCFVHADHGDGADLPRFCGWWGHDPQTRFRMHLEPEFVARGGAESWQLSNPPILALAPLRASLELFERAGMSALRGKSQMLTAYLQRLLDGLEPRVRVITPRDPAARGCQLSLIVERQAQACLDALAAAGMVCDVRKPNVIRVAPVPLYNTFHEVWRFADLLDRATTASAAVMASDKPTCTIVGAGLSGALMAVYLGQDGYDVDMYEKRPDPRLAGTAGGRSINLALSTRGIHALAQVGVADEVLADAVPMRGRMMHDLDGTLTFQPYGTARDQVIHSVSRGGLNIALLDAAERCPSVRLHFDACCVGADLETGAALLKGPDGTSRRVGGGGLLIGSDGAFSAVRGEMQHGDCFDYSQHYLSHGYKELCIPANGSGGFRMEPHALHIWPRGGYMMIALPNADGSYTCTCFWPLEGPNSFKQIATPAAARSFFEANFSDAVPLMPTLEADYRDNPASSLVTVRCGPWHWRDRVVLIGDAAHAVVPFYGQGMNASFEDCTALAACLREWAPDCAAALAAYYARRKVHTDALADLAVGNFLEMRDHVASRWFLAKKAAGRALHRLLPRTFIPLYSMVTFSTMPYADAVARQKRQTHLLAGIGAVLGLCILGLWWLISQWGAPT